MTKRIKILSWNIQQGGGTRIKQILAYINYSSFDIITLSEFQNTNKGTAIRKYLLEQGFAFQAVSRNNSSKNSVLIASTIPFNSTIYKDIDPEYSENIILAEFAEFRLFACYLPHKKTHQLFDHLIDVANRGLPCIIAGDLNSGINGLDQKGKSFWYEDDLLTLDRNGIIDIFRVKNGAVKEYSWYSHQGNGYRYDHILADEKLIPVISACYYEHAVREAKISDHSPMILELDM